MGEIPSTVCPDCEYVATDRTPIYDDDSEPVEGAVSLCLMCGFVSKYDADLQLVRPDLEALIEIAEDEELMRVRDRMLMDIERRKYG